MTLVAGLEPVHHPGPLLALLVAGAPVGLLAVLRGGSDLAPAPLGLPALRRGSALAALSRRGGGRLDQLGGRTAGSSKHRRQQYPTPDAADRALVVAPRPIWARGGRAPCVTID